jgi:putative ABC transport system substrate-binding protein
MKRRALLALLGGMVAWPPGARAEQSIPVIGFLNGQSPAEVTRYMAAFHKGLNEAGYAEGRDITIEYRWAEDRRDRLPALAADLVHRQVAVIVATGGTPAAPRRRSKAATATIPIVFTTGTDPVEIGLVAGLNRPNGNATGASFLFNALGPKRLGLLHELVPTATMIGYLTNPANPSYASDLQDIHTAVRALGLRIGVQNVSNEHGIEAAFSNFVQQRVEAVIVAADTQFIVWRDQLAALAARHALPASYHAREIVEAGGLMCYGPSQADAYCQAGIYVGHILKGKRPADLPVVQSTKFELMINLKTAKTLNLAVPAMLLAQADEVIE